MLNALTPVLEPVARITVAALFNSLWEAVVLALAVWAMLRLLPNLNATTRYAAWCVALVGSLLLPIATAVPQTTVKTAVQSSPAASPARLPLRAASRKSSSSATIAKAAPVSVAATPQTGAPAFRFPQRLQFALPQYVALALFAAWLFGALLLLVRLAVNLLRLEHLKRDALPLPVEYRERLSQWAVAEKGERDVRLCVCDRIEVPVAVGLFDSMILLPQHLLATLSPEEVDQIMLHELGHLRRADDWTNGLQRVIQALFFFNPAILYISQQLDLEREVACDDWVVHQTKSVRPYATCLTRMAEVTAWPHHPLAAPGVFVTRRGLSIRVERLLRAGRNVRTSIAFGPAGMIVAALIVMFFVLQSVAPSFAFTVPCPPVAPAPLVKAKVPSVHERIVYRNVEVPVRVASAGGERAAAPTPTPLDVTIPAQHIHLGARTIHIPAVNVDTPEQHFHMAVPVPNVRPSLPSDLGVKITRQIDAAMRRSGFAASRAGMAAAYAASGAAASAIASSTGKGFNCTGCDYSNQNLAGKSFRGQRLNGSDFSHSNLQNADFSGTSIIGVDFSHANLRGATFAHAVMNGCDLSHANLTDVNFDGVQMIGCDVDAHSLSPTQARSLILACRNGCDFSGAHLAGEDLRGIALTGVDLSGADLRGADLSNSRLNGVNFSGANLDGARFSGASLTGCDLSGVDLSRVDLSGAKMVGDKLTDPR